MLSSGRTREVKTGEIVSNKVVELLDMDEKRVYELADSGRAINTASTHFYLIKVNDKNKCEQLTGDVWNENHNEFDEEKGCARRVFVLELQEGDYIVVPSLSSISFGDNTSIEPLERNSFNLLSPENIEQPSFKDNATYCTSFKCPRSKFLASGICSENSDLGIKVICPSTSSMFFQIFLWIALMQKIFFLYVFLILPIRILERQNRIWMLMN